MKVKRIISDIDGLMDFLSLYKDGLIAFNKAIFNKQRYFPVIKDDKIIAIIKFW